MLIRKRYLSSLLLITIYVFYFAIAQAQQNENIEGVDIINSVCDGGQSSAYVQFVINQELDRWLLFEIENSTPIAFEITGKTDVAINFITPVGTTPSSVINLTVSIGTAPYDTSIDQIITEFDCELSGEVTPTDEPTDTPTDEPTDTPTDEPTDTPTDEPTDTPTDEPTDTPTDEPTDTPTDEPTDTPTDEPTDTPTDEPATPDCSMSYASPSILWPPNHQMVGVSIKGVTGYTSIQIANIYVNEPDNATGDGNTIGDIGGIGTDTAWVRAERAGNGVGRTYVISFIATNENGGTCAAIVSSGVPHNQGAGASNGQAQNNAVVQQQVMQPVVTPDPHNADVAVTPEPPAVIITEVPVINTDNIGNDNVGNNIGTNNIGNDNTGDTSVGGHDNGNGKSKGKALGKLKKDNN